MKQNKVRIADVAEELGLSTATVSNVLHGKTNKMSEATIKRVEQKLEQSLLFVFALYAPVKIENMILGGGILKSGGDTKTVMLIDIVGTWGMGIPLCFAGAYLLQWGIVGVYALLTSEEILRLVISLIIFRKKKWMISLA